MVVRDRHYIDGQWTAPSGQGHIDVIDATTGEVMARVPEGAPEDVDAAVAAAAAAFPAWSALPLEDRAAVCRQIADGLNARGAEIAEFISRELGTPHVLAVAVQTGTPLTTFASMADFGPELSLEEEIGGTTVVKEAIGVVGAMTPWNFPLHQVAAKVAPALLTGCTVVLKPSEVCPMSAFVLAEVIDELGLPPGVFNLVTGYGPVVGEAIAAHPDVDMVSLTGSTRAGRRVGELAAQTVKRVTLELGGKGANVLLDDVDGADLQAAVGGALGNCYFNAGQACAALTRLVVPRSRLADVERLAVAAAESFVPGDPFDPATTVGPLVSDVQRERVREYISKGIEEGAWLLTGGVEPPDGLDQGYFVRPTVFTDVDPRSVIAQEEIFGPVLVIIPYDDEDHAVEIANGTAYGLTSGVWSTDRDRAAAFARRMRTGVVFINGATLNPLAPFGGYKQSGNGRELGRLAIDEFLEVKAVY
ncbi:aldehyde dehydrogenase family protein [Phytoactinopolyspora endophytica]|uniref:aldehyde dehydrogenase family protein n=1 Tax=Phytoactinopolyspora endophytica TaxID=1642495 RepID=UPI00101CD997